MKTRSSAYRAAIRIAVVTGLILLIPLVLMLIGDDGTNWSVFDFALAAVLLSGAGLLLELAVRRPRSVVYRAAATVIGLAAMALGEADDAPGLFGFGLLLIAGAIALGMRRRSAS
jgi:peptidoglycan/LPS O-acetylase OafA/YrhL